MPSSSPVVSVIIPTYNSSGTLKLSLETVLLQDITDFEVIVVGDGCTDDSEKVVASVGDDRVFWANITPNSGGPSLPRNEGLRLAKGKFIAYLGHDDLWFPWHLTELLDLIERNNSEFVFSLGAIIGKMGIVGVFSIPDNPWRRGISPSNWLHGKCLTDVIGPWSTDIKYGDDQDFLQRILKANVRIDFHRQISVLKFPSDLWRMYSLTSNFPQSKYVKAMHHDPEALRLEILLDLATIISRHDLLVGRSSGLLPRPLGSLAKHIIDIYGMQRWPIRNLLHWRWRKLSGLADEGPIRSLTVEK